MIKDNKKEPKFLKFFFSNTKNSVSFLVSLGLTLTLSIIVLSSWAEDYNWIINVPLSKTSRKDLEQAHKIISRYPDHIFHEYSLPNNKVLELLDFSSPVFSSLELISRHFTIKNRILHPKIPLHKFLSLYMWNLCQTHQILEKMIMEDPLIIGPGYL